MRWVCAFVTPVFLAGLVAANGIPMRLINNGDGGVVPKGDKLVDLDIQIDNLNDYPDLDFYLLPVRAATRLEPDRSTSLSGNGLVKLHAISTKEYRGPGSPPIRGKPLTSEFDVLQPGGPYQNFEELPVQRRVKAWDMTTRVVVHYKVTIKDKILSMTKVGEEHFDANGAPVNPLATAKRQQPKSSTAWITTVAAVKTDGANPWLDSETALETRLWYYLGIPIAAFVLIGLRLCGVDTKLARYLFSTNHPEKIVSSEAN